MQLKLLLALITLILQACLLPQAAGPVDPVFSNMRANYDTQLKANITNIDSATAQFDGALTGLTDTQKDTPKYKSLVGRYDAILKQTAAAKQKAEVLLAWAAQTETTATLQDRNRLQSEAQALNIEFSNLSATVHQLPSEINVIQMTSR